MRNAHWHVVKMPFTKRYMTLLAISTYQARLLSGVMKRKHLGLIIFMPFLGLFLKNTHMRWLQCTSSLIWPHDSLS